MVYADVVIGKRGSSEELTYAVPARIIPYIRVGSLVEVPVRDKKVKAVVVNLHKRVDAELKGKVREMVSINRKISHLPDSQLQVAKKLAKKYLTNPSDVIFRSLSLLRNIEQKEVKNSGKVKYLQSVWQDRVTYYIEVVKSFDEVLIIFPTNQHLKAFKDVAAKNINHEIVELTRGKSLNELEKIKKILFLGTVGYSFLPIKAGGLVVIDQPNHIGSRYSNRPYLKSEDIALVRNEFEKVNTIIGQSIISPYQLLKIKNKEAELEAVKPSKINITISSRVGSGGIFLPSTVEKVKKSNRVCFFVASKGWSSGYYCRDCRELVRCSACKRVSGANPENLECRYCGQINGLPQKCSSCGKSNLVLLGEGVDMVVKEIKEIFKPKNYQVIAGKYAKYNPEIKITLATEKILSFPMAKFDQIVIVSADRALTGGEIDDQWKFLLILKELSAMSKELIVQTYLLENRVWESIGSGNAKNFFESELSERKKYNLPPFSGQLNIVGSSKNQQTLEKQLSKFTESIQKLKEIEFSTSEIQTEKNTQAVVRLQLIFPKNSEYLLKIIAEILPPNWAVLPV